MKNMSNRKVIDYNFVQYQNFFDLSLEPIVIYTNGIVVYINEAGVELIGGSRAEEIVGMPIIDFLHPDYLESTIAQIKSLFEHGKASDEIIEKKWIRLDGQVITVQIRALPVLFQGDHAIQLLCRDVTDRRRTENSLHESEERYRRLLQMTPEAVVIHSEGIIVYANDAAAKLVRADNSSQIVGKQILDFFHIDFQEKVKGRLTQLEQAMNDHNFCEYKLIRLDGDLFIGEAASIEVYKYLGKTVFQTVIRDISERIKKEEFLRQSDKLSAMGQLAAGVAHEIRNPLTALMGFTKLLQAKNEENKTYCDIMESELQRINVILDEFMQLSKPRLKSVKEHDVYNILNNLIAVLETQAILRNVEINMQFEKDVPSILCDENQLKQVFVNIMKNAIEAMDNGGNLNISIKKHGDHVLVCFVDEGSGIPKEKIPKLGEPFFTTKENGTGLGLAVSYNIIQAHNGKVHIDSEVGKGTIVSIYLPLLPLSSN